MPETFTERCSKLCDNYLPEQTRCTQENVPVQYRDLCHLTHTPEQIDADREIRAHIRPPNQAIKHVPKSSISETGISEPRYSVRMCRHH